MIKDSGDLPGDSWLETLGIRVYVIHVAGNVEREKYITAELAKHRIRGEFILEGNKETITTAQLDRYFAGEMKAPNAKTSCALKHFLAYERLLKSSAGAALILEDDIKLYPNFDSQFAQSLTELKDRHIDGCLASYEDFRLDLVPKSEQKNGVLLYPQKRGRCTGAYLVDRKAAQNLLETAITDKCGLPIDWFHNRCAELGRIGIYWCHPAIAVQRSINGTMASLISDSKPTLKRRMRHAYRKLRKALGFY